MLRLAPPLSITPPRSTLNIALRLVSPQRRKAHLQLDPFLLPNAVGCCASDTARWVPELALAIVGRQAEGGPRVCRGVPPIAPPDQGPLALTDGTSDEKG